MSNQIRALILFLSLAMGITFAVGWRAWRTARSVPDSVTYSIPKSNSDGDGEETIIKLPKSATQPAEGVVSKVYAPVNEKPIVKIKLPANPEMLLARASPAVLRIIAHDAKGEPIAQGSGFLISTSGLVVTNYNIVKGSQSLSVLYENKKKAEVEGLAAVDPDGNLALIKIKGSLPAPLQFAPGEPPAGAQTFAIGNPLGLKNTLAEGEVSNVRKEGNTLTLIQTTSAISPGASGGPLLNEDGKVLGVATLYMSQGETQNLAIGRDRIQKLLDSYKGGVIPAAKQVWVSNNVERDQIAYWLAKAAAEAPKMVTDRPRICGWIAEGYARSGDPKGLAKILTLVEGGEPWQQEANAAGLRARAGDADGASASIDASTNPKVRLHGHVNIATALNQRNDTIGFAREIQLAADAAKAQKDPIIRGDWLLVIIKACADAGQHEQGMSLVEQLADTGDPNLNAKANPTGSKRNFKSSGLTHLAVGKAKARDWAGAEELAGQVFDEYDKSYAYMSIAEQRARANDPAGALATARRISVGFMKNRAMLETAESAARAGDRNRAVDALAEAISASGNIKENWRRAEAEQRLISALALCGDIASALKKAGELGDDASRSLAYGYIAVAYAKRGDSKGMNAALAKIKDQWAAVPAMTEVALVQARSGQLRAALRTLDKVPNAEVRMEATRSAVKAASGKLPAEKVAENAAALTLPEQRAAAYLGLAEGIMDRDSSATARTPME
jgi:S1-C subfamily serine protease